MNISVVDGEDLSRFDDVGATDTVNKEDTETLDKLEWELASQSGRLTGIDILLWFLVCLFLTLGCLSVDFPFLSDFTISPT